MCAVITEILTQMCERFMNGEHHTFFKLRKLDIYMIVMFTAHNFLIFFCQSCETNSFRNPHAKDRKNTHYWTLNFNNRF